MEIEAENWVLVIAKFSLIIMDIFCIFNFNFHSHFQHLCSFKSWSVAVIPTKLWPDQETDLIPNIVELVQSFMGGVVGGWSKPLCRPLQLELS